MLKFDCCFTTNVGKVRKNNEDNFYLNGDYKRTPEEIQYEKRDLIYRGGLFAVCDGMGGEEFGEKASLFAVEILKNYQNKDFNSYVEEYITEANTRICKLIEENNGTRSGTTLALVYINDKVTCYNIGDSRIYLFHNGTLRQISEDHTQISQLIKMGVLSPEQAKTHKDRHVLTQHLGIFPDEMIIQPYKAKEFSLCNDDVILLCSDGLTDMLSDKDIEEILKRGTSAKECANSLIDKALTNGGKDNVTVGLIKTIGKKEKFFEKLWRR